MKVSNTKINRFNQSAIKTVLACPLPPQARHQKIQHIKFFNTELHTGGFVLKTITSFKPKHIEYLVAKWKQDGLSPGRIKNLMSDLRFVCRLTRKPEIIQSNSFYGIENRSLIGAQNRAVDNIKTDGIESEFLKASLRLQQAFGLRREECLKFKPHMADNGSYIRLEKTWTKGGVGRVVPISNPEQRDALKHAKSLIKVGESMIPADTSYIQWRKLYDKKVLAAGNRNLHGLRHAYAQKRYMELTGGRKPLICGGKKPQTLEEKTIDQAARKAISQELGHARVQITRAYLG